ncbi:MAG TPA: hypothetical protein VGI20_08550 [Rhizomicrobium sp.]
MPEAISLTRIVPNVRRVGQSNETHVKWFIGGFLVVVAVAAWAWDGAWVLGYLPTRVNDLTFVSLDPFHAKDGRDSLHLRFRSDQNLRTLTEQSGAFGAYAKLSLCPFRDNPWVSVARVGHNGVDLSTRPTRSCAWHRGKFAGCKTMDDSPQVRAEIASVDKLRGPFVYDIAFTYYSQWLTYKSFGITQRRIPLPPVPQDLCVKIHGDGGPPGLQSNVFVIPKANLLRALGGSKVPPLAPATWYSDPYRLNCETRARTLGQSVLLALGPNHGSELAVHRLSDDVWFALVTDSPPSDMHSVMTPREYAEVRRLKLPADVTGYQWWSNEGGQKRIFTVAGDYVVYSSDNIESSSPGLGCSINFSNSRGP